MRNRLTFIFGTGLVFVAAAIAIFFYVQRGAHLELRGRVLKVRTAALEENSSVAVVDFRVENGADYPFLVGSITVTVDGAGKVTEGVIFPGIDARRLFPSIPLLGKQYNEPLIPHDELAAHSTQDRMVAARFDLPVAQLEKRSGLRIRFVEAAGTVSEIHE